MPPVTLPSKELSELQRRFKKGYSVERTGGDHFQVLDPGGEPIRNEDGLPLTIPGTPHGGRQTKNIEQQLKAAGVLRGEPRRPPRITDEAKRRRAEGLREAYQVRQRNRQRTADELWARLNKALKPVGGFELPGTQADLAHVGTMLMRRNGGQATPDLLSSSIHRVFHKGWVEPRYQTVWNEVADLMEESDDPSETFFTLVRHARGLPDIERHKPVAGEWPFKVELIAIDNLLVDHDYQRPVPWRFVRKMAAAFDPTLVGTIDVSERRGGRYAIIDGQLRWEATKLQGLTSMWCSIYVDLDKAGEAAHFLRKNEDKKVIHPFYIFKARLTAKDEVAVAVQRIVDETGYKLTFSSKVNQGVGIIVAVASLMSVYEMKGAGREEALTPTLQMLHETTWGKPFGQSAVLIRGLGRFFARFADDEFDRDRLVSTLADRTPLYLINRAKELARSNNSTAELYMERVIVDEYNTGLRRQSERLSFEGQPQKRLVA